MKDAEKQLTEVAEKSSIAALSPALAAEQAAYQALLKLRAGEFQVIRNNSRQRQSGRSSARQPVATAAPAARALDRGEPLRRAAHGPVADKSNQSQREREQARNAAGAQPPPRAGPAADAT